MYVCVRNIIGHRRNDHVTWKGWMTPNSEKMSYRINHLASHNFSYIHVLKTRKRNHLMQHKFLETFDGDSLQSFQPKRYFNIYSYVSKEYSNSLHSLKQNYDNLKSRNEFKTRLSSMLVESYIKSNQLEEANKVIEETRKNVKHYFIKSDVIKIYIDKCIELNIMNEAKNCIQNEVVGPKDAKILPSTLIDLSLAMSENGHHDDAIRLIKSVKVSKILNDRRDKEFARILGYYVEKCDHLRLQGIV